ncbi:phage head-tail adaptor, putative, SPP1 family [Paenibacillus sp. UNCCL117]|uniref:phage head closure protein n=1 Tax=unclassified Paenibacillus TaxID=185978 RepID=UPI0008887878|nr:MULTISPECIES: phage head closure protein [unclassified Paenibacillus]SDD27078.1 phage head-tail adaptor, putative, SPP1 family [Paenibacillus sp. cl123]SFW40608.1 phage head-tail adaptor, putative, SPP1 family [Paenibacillus sp. UNCCL117]
MSNPTNPSKYDRRIKIQRQDGHTTDNEGIFTPNWVDIISLWAARRPLRGREFFAAAAVNAENTVRYEIRCRQGIAEDMRLIDSGRIYNIMAVLDDPKGDGTETHLMTQEALKNG